MKAALKKSRPGSALLAVLFVVMAVMVVSLAFITRSNMELTAGKNMADFVQTDYIALSGLEHARALIKNPDNPTPITSWQGTGLQIGGSDGCYDLTISNQITVPSADPNGLPVYFYDVSCTAYKQKNGAVCARSCLDAKVRFDPSTTKVIYTSIKTK